eukprot:5822025-Amphidinium_carterae.3
MSTTVVTTPSQQGEAGNGGFKTPSQAEDGGILVAGHSPAPVRCLSAAFAEATEVQPSASSAVTGSERGSIEGSEAPADPSMCSLCCKKQRAAKCRYCAVCKSDVQAARREADLAGRLQSFAALAKAGGSEFTDLMHEYVKSNASRRKYSQRTKFDFLKYEEARKVQSSLRLGHKAIFMHRDRAIKHFEDTLGLSRKESLERWDLEEGRAKHKLYNGLASSPLQIPIHCDDFLIMENALIGEKTMTKCHKQVKHTADQEDLMQEGLASGTTALAPGDLERFGCEQDDLASRLFFGNAEAQMDRSLALPLGDDETVQMGQTKKTKVFDKEAELLALQNKILSLVRKGGEELMSVAEEAKMLQVDANAETAVASHNEKEAVELMQKRSKGAELLLGSWVAEMQTATDKDVASVREAGIARSRSEIPPQ